MPRCAVNSMAPSTIAYSTAPSSSYSRTGRSAGPESSVAQPSSANVSTSRCDCEAAPDVQVPETSNSHALIAVCVAAEHASAHARIAGHGTGRETAADPASGMPSRAVVRNALRLRVTRRQAASLSSKSSVQTVGEPSTSGGNASPSWMNTTAPDGPCDRYGPDALHVSPVLPLTVAVVSDISFLPANDRMSYERVGGSYWPPDELTSSESAARGMRSSRTCSRSLRALSSAKKRNGTRDRGLSSEMRSSIPQSSA